MVKYRIVNRKNPQDQSDPGKFYASLNHSRKAGIREIAERISKRSTVNSIDCMGMLEAFVQVIPELMAEGAMIDMGEFGSFYGTLQSEGTPTEAEFNAARIQKMKLHFRPGKEFQKTLRNLLFAKTQDSSNHSAA